MATRPVASRSMQELRIHASDPDAPALLAARIAALRSAGGARSLPVVVLCIGTDRSTGDALGPLVGTRLQESGIPWQVLGTVDHPVHATNLERALADLNESLPHRFVIAVDACLGRLENVGTIGVNAGPLQPGAGVNKNLPPVGDVAVTGTVNVGGFMEYLILQNTRLSVVLHLARAVSAGLIRAAASVDSLSPASREAAAAGDHAKPPAGLRILGPARG